MGQHSTTGATHGAGHVLGHDMLLYAGGLGPGDLHDVLVQALVDEAALAFLEHVARADQAGLRRLAQPVRKDAQARVARLSSRSRSRDKTKDSLG